MLHPITLLWKKQVVFEGKITSAEQWDGEFFIVLEVLSGELEVGKDVYVWIMTSFEDKDEIAYTGNYHIEADETDNGKIVKIVAVKSTSDGSEIWRLKEINLK